MLQRLIPPSIFLILFLAVILFAPNVAEANNSPTAVGTISGQTLVGGETTATVDVSSNFNDPDGDTLTYTASSSDETQVTVSVSGATVTLTSGSVDNLPVDCNGDRPRRFDRYTNHFSDCGQSQPRAYDSHSNSGHKNYKQSHL